MSGTYRWKKAGFALIASLMMTTAPVVFSCPAFAQVDNFNNPVPEVEVDGSVLQQFDSSALSTATMAPVSLISPNVSRKATTNSGPTLTDDTAFDPSAGHDVAAEKLAAETPDDAPILNAFKPAPQDIIDVARTTMMAPPPPVRPMLTTAIEPSIIQQPVALASQIKAGAVSSRPMGLTDDSRPQAIVQKVLTASGPEQEIARTEVKPVLKIAPAPDAASIAAIEPASGSSAPVASLPAVSVASLPVVPAPVALLPVAAPPVIARIIETPAPAPAIVAAIKPPMVSKPVVLSPVIAAPTVPRISEAPGATVAAIKPPVVSAPVIPKIIETPAPIPAPAPVLAAAPVALPKTAPVVAAVKPIEAPKILVRETEDKLITQVVMDAPGVTLPATPLAPAPKIVAAAKPIIATPIKSQEREDNILTTPPKLMAENPSVKAATTKPVSFPISSTSKTRGEIDPSPSVEANTPQVPAAPTANTKTAQAAIKNMVKPDAGQDDLGPVTTLNLQPDNSGPAVIYRNVPTPKPRPNVIVASRDFVERARRSYEDTYTIVNRDGDRMPDVQNQKIIKENLSAGKVAPTRISVADIAADPLASKLVSMTPDDIASTLNGITPSSGNSNARMGDLEDVRPSQRVRIVRETGNWTPRKPIEPQQRTASMDSLGSSNDMPARSADGHYNITFKSGATDLPAALFGEVDNGIVSALKANGNARVQIVAYASAEDGKEITAKKTSLARALSLRSYLISKGIDATRMDVRAIGIQKDTKAAQDQVEMIILPSDAKKT